MLIKTENYLDWKILHEGECKKEILNTKKEENYEITTESPKAKLKKLTSKPKKVSNGLKTINCSQRFNPVCGIYAGVKSTFHNECMMKAESINTQKGRSKCLNGNKIFLLFMFLFS